MTARRRRAVRGRIGDGGLAHGCLDEGGQSAGALTAVGLSWDVFAAAVSPRAY